MIYEPPPQPPGPPQKFRRSRGWRLGVAGLAGILGMSGLAGCDHLGGAVGEITESFQKRLDEKDKEIAALRASETALRVQVSELQARAQTQPESGGRGSVDVAALARELAPLLAAGRAEPIQRAETPGAPPPPASGLPELKLSEPKVRAKDEAPPRPRTSGEPRSPGGSGVKRPEPFEPVAR